MVDRLRSPALDCDTMLDHRVSVFLLGFKEGQVFFEGGFWYHPVRRRCCEEDERLFLRREALFPGQFFVPRSLFVVHEGACLRHVVGYRGEKDHQRWVLLLVRRYVVRELGWEGWQWEVLLLLPVLLLLLLLLMVLLLVLLLLMVLLLLAVLLLLVLLLLLMMLVLVLLLVRLLVVSSLG